MKKLIPAFVCLLSLFVLLSGTQTAFGSDTNIQYDSSRYNIEVYAENNEDNELCCSVIAFQAGAGSKAESVAFQDIVLSDTVTTAAAASTTLTYTTAVTTVTTAVTTKEHKTDIMDSILTGDRFPAHAIRLVMLLAAMTAIFAFLFKQKQSEEDEKNE